jgi:hypothetical protein
MYSIVIDCGMYYRKSKLGWHRGIFQYNNVLQTQIMYSIGIDCGTYYRKTKLGWHRGIFQYNNVLHSDGEVQWEWNSLYKRRRRITHIVSRQYPRTNSTDVRATYVTYAKFVSHVWRNGNKRTQLKAN